MGTVLALYTCADAGLPMVSVTTIRAIAGIGLEGDRYALGKGIFSKGPRIAIRHVSLIAIEGIVAANRELSKPFSPEETRRNILTVGIDLNALVGCSFHVGSVHMRGTELCDPCFRPAKLREDLKEEQKLFKRSYENRGGLRAEILSSGIITVGDPIVPAKKLDSNEPSESDIFNELYYKVRARTASRPLPVVVLPLQLCDFVQRLSIIIHHEDIVEWMEEKKKSLRGRSPLDAIVEGDFKAVSRIIAGFESPAAT